ncbi:unnamed protein product [Rotaria sp. Silwood1]|nr:unnamed protein product [Rotaria sp. Silwood1]CAF1651276.1 unnamed protein product [Rotaria sp. Silwood1]CAF3843120.1 unnamed protein product [Rotaria sp. Silwood1]CAF3885300.1 unnamed protein product [Rotaria sp. Silwood1]CAF4978195.1 unnamed protein product [Rotaria sp. Silwood1]
MGNLISAVRLPGVQVCTSSNKLFALTYSALIDHAKLLREVIAHPEMTKEGTTLDYFIKQYCIRMQNDEMGTSYQQWLLPWQIDWIWHVHRLHPVAYFHDSEDGGGSLGGCGGGCGGCGGCGGG